MVSINWHWDKIKKLVLSLIGVILVVVISGCGDRIEKPQTTLPEASTPQVVKQISEVSPPKLIQKLHQSLDSYQPKVKILSPKFNEILQDNTVNVKLQVQNLPLFKQAQLGLGPHLQVILDNQPPIAVYDTQQPLVFPDIQPGTHTLRVFATAPWDESFKNEGAFALTAFHIFTKTPTHNPDPNLPLLTYNSPQGIYGAEPILLDFYLTNAPLHFVAQENPEDEIIDWRVRVSVNGESFIVDQWQPIYLKGLKPGKNWVQLEYLDEQGQPLNNVYNNTARLVIYDPNLENPLTQLVQGKLSKAQARAIVDPNFILPEPAKTPEPEIPSPEPTSTFEETPESTEPETPVEEIPEPAEPETPVEEIPEPAEPETAVEVIPEPVESETAIEPILESTEPETAIEPILESTEPETAVEVIPEPAEPETAIEPILESTEPETPVEVIPELTEPETVIEQILEPTAVEAPAQDIFAPEAEITLEPAPAPTELTLPPEAPTAIEVQPDVRTEPSSNPQPQITLPDFSEFVSKIKEVFNGFQLPFLSASPAQPTPAQTLPEIVNEVPVPEAVEQTSPGESAELIPDTQEQTHTKTDS